MRKKLGVITIAAAALFATPVALNPPGASASYCQADVPGVCDIYNGGARVLCGAVANAKLGDCIQ